MEHWYALQTKPKAEYQVADLLRLRDLEVYLPEIKYRKTRKPAKNQPFFPNYLFLRADLTVVELSTIQWTPGLLRLISFDNEPVPVPIEIIDLIRQKLEALNRNGGTPRHDFTPGETVQITDGPFEDMVAIFDQPTSSADRVRVLLEFLGRASRVEVDPADLKKVTPNPDEPAAAPQKRPRRTRGRGRRIRPKD